MHAPAPGPLPAVLPAPPPIPLSYRDRFATLFGPAMTMEDQVATFARLKLDIDNGANEDEAHGAPAHAAQSTGCLVEGARGDRRVPRRAGRPRRPPETAPPGRGDAAVGAAATPRVDLPRAGWYADPTGRFEMRYWDGTRVDRARRSGRSAVQ